MKYRIRVDDGHLSYRGKSSWCRSQARKLIKELGLHQIQATLEPCHEQP